MILVLHLATFVEGVVALGEELVLVLATIIVDSIVSLSALAVRAGVEFVVLSRRLSTEYLFVVESLRWFVGFVVVLEAGEAGIAAFRRVYRSRK